MKTVRLTDFEADVLRGILGFVDAGDISGGPLDCGDYRGDDIGWGRASMAKIAAVERIQAKLA